MEASRLLLRRAFGPSSRDSLSFKRPGLRNQSTSNPADNPNFTSIVDNPPTLVRSGRKHSLLGLTLLAAIPVTAFALGCWQVKRLEWKTNLIAKYEHRLQREPLPLPPHVDPTALDEFDYRIVTAKGRYCHDREMLLGPRLRDGDNGYLVITPLKRKDGSTILVCRGWIPKEKAQQSARPEGLPQGEVQVMGLLRAPWKKNMFTPANKPDEGSWYFPDVKQMADHAHAQPIWVEEVMSPDLLEGYRRIDKGIPIGRPAEVNLRNNHTQYIFTWFSLSLATSVMLFMVMKQSRGGNTRVRRNVNW
ncbi:putative COX1 assembly protein Shy1 [Piedraia hortae CBS 480.64]|uniref:SURF1-like protein n=1 Tax=Piedraia hortae CBS 480.64 TaxID=1314780 RepID=A0A6A7C337_9PEZI|nr:putative COX1 assembly protein Shy1 [Piedraia hortae CBS 480.64]